MQHEAEMQLKNEEIRQKNAQLEQIQVYNIEPFHSIPSSFSLPRPIRHDCDNKGYMQYATSLSRFPYNYSCYIKIIL